MMTVSPARRGLWAAISLFVFVCSPAFAQQPVSQAAKDLVGAVYPKARIGTELRPLLQKNPKIFAIWSAGASGAMVKLYHVYPQIEAIVFSKLPGLHEQIAPVYAATFSDSELAALTKFHTSPLWKKFSKADLEVSAEIPKFMSGVGSSYVQNKVSPAQWAAAHRLAMLVANLPKDLPFHDEIVNLQSLIYASRLSIEELDAISAFHSSELGKKFDATAAERNKKVDEVTVGWLMALAEREPILFEADAGE